MNIKGIEAFVTVAAAGAVQSAAEDLGVSQSVITRRLQSLEAELGVSLLDRETRPPKISAKGAAVLEMSREILEQATSIRDLCAPRDTTAGPIRVGLAHGVEDLGLAAPLDELRRTRSWDDLHLSSDWSAHLMSKVIDGRLDAAIVLLPSHLSPPPEVKARLIGQEQVLIVAARDADFPGNPTAHDFRNQAWILNGEGCGHRAALREVLRRENLPFDVRIETFSVEIQMSLVGRGAGLGLVGPRLFAKSAHRSELKILHPSDFSLSVGIWCIEKQEQSKARQSLLRSFGASIAKAL